jgi:DNA-binding response OmpR family regulator
MDDICGDDAPSMPLLLVEDNAVLAASLARGLREDGFEVDAVATGADAIKRLARRDVDGVVLDLGLPDIDGRRLRRSRRSLCRASASR